MYGAPSPALVPHPAAFTRAGGALEMGRGVSKNGADSERGTISSAVAGRERPRNGKEPSAACCVAERVASNWNWSDKNRQWSARNEPQAGRICRL